MTKVEDLGIKSKYIEYQIINSIDQTEILILFEEVKSNQTIQFS